ncbi:MerR family transcriptional regulator [Jeotgalibacillus proteolyticus]|uniref:DNA-binding protein n=1 Tax=Jeotgalibacillus proteolyticus TaxID=2082395 RepID=A0A2S5G6R6_9BACL|nr:MerR family transcriptional regulator [Jeotgalibacillus proteolyticus]PPA68676.1 DNA-binding protein [Jeotgalibacillus proteolyticus]PPA68753.1 DNA-binding protein [Jeotgalibacillus proteolyticus]
MNVIENQCTENLNENISDLRLTVKEAAQHIEESPGVVRNWMRELKTHIPTIIGENGYHYFDKIALERLRLIKQLNRVQNYSLKQIEYYLATGGEKTKPEPKQEISLLILDDLKEIKRQLDLQKDFNEVLIQQLKKQQLHMDSQQKFLTEMIEKRDEQLLMVIKEKQTKQENIPEEDVPKKKGFFSWFK